MKDEAKIETPPLDTEAATRQQDPWNAGFIGPILTNDPLLLERAEHGSMAFELYRDLKRDGKVFAALQKRKLAVIGREWTVKPLVDNEQGERDARLVTDILQGFAFDRLCSALLDAIIIGWQPAEVVWTLKDLPTESGGTRQVVAPARVPKRLQRRFIYKDTEDGRPPELRLLTREQMQDGEPVLPRKFIVHTIEGEDGNPYGSGLGLQLFWPVFFKRKGVLCWNKFCDRFGTPTPWGKYLRSASAREKGTLFDALRAFSNDGFVMTPEGTMIELLESKLSSSGLTPNQSLVEYMDDWIAEVLLGQPPRSGSGGALAAAANEREDVRLELSQADSDLLSETLNATLIKWICELNGLQECVVYRSITKEADLKLESETETDVNVASLGFKPSLEQIRGKYGDGWEEAAPAVPATAPDKPAPSSFAEPGALASEKDAIDELIQQELDQWRPVMEPMVAPLRQLLQDAARRGLTLEQVLQELPQALPEMDTAALTESLTGTAYATRLAAEAGMLPQSE